MYTNFKLPEFNDVFSSQAVPRPSYPVPRKDSPALFDYEISLIMAGLAQIAHWTKAMKLTAQCSRLTAHCFDLDNPGEIDYESSR